jgi:NAD(P)H-dependent FMN reductase
MKLLVVLGSVRAGRAGQNVADWFNKIAKQHADVEFVDLKELALPLEMEETLPSAVNDFSYSSKETKAWSDKVEAADAVVFIHPEYNHSISAPLKNAIDHIYHEWNGKPLGLVSYGASGGGDAADHIKWIGKFTKWEVVEPRVSISQIWAAFDEDGNLAGSDEHTAEAEKMLQSLESKVQ